MSSREIVYVAKTLTEAYMLRAALEAAGISATILNEALNRTEGDSPFFWDTAPRLEVATTDRDAAVQVLHAHGVSS